MRYSNINLECEAKDLLESCSELMNTAMQGTMTLDAIANMSDTEWAMVRSMKQLYDKTTEYSVHQAKKIDELDRKITDLYNLIEERK